MSKEKPITERQKNYLMNMCETKAYGIPRKDYIQAINNIEKSFQASLIIQKSIYGNFEWIDEWLYKQKGDKNE